MDNQVREKLRMIVAKHGNAVAEDSRLCRGLLNDYCPQHKPEVNLLLSALEEKVPSRLLNEGGPAADRCRRLARLLEKHRHVTSEAAGWAVDSWGLALGVISNPPWAQW